MNHVNKVFRLLFPATYYHVFMCDVDPNAPSLFDFATGPERGLFRRITFQEIFLNARPSDIFFKIKMPDLLTDLRMLQPNIKKILPNTKMPQ